MSTYIATPPPLPEPEVWRDGKLLVFLKDAQLPRRCVKTNEPTDDTLRRKLSWHEPALYFLILAGLLVYVILAMILRNTATVDVPLGAQARAKRKRHIIIAWLIALAGGVALVVGFSGDGPSPVALVGLALLMVSPIYGLIAVPTVRPKKIDDCRVYLTGVCEAYLAQLPERKI